MRVPLSWLREFVDVDLEPGLAERLTLLGMEVQSIERWGADWRDVVVGELAVEVHPRADRLSLTTVNLGSGEPLSVVCGATNIAPGQRVPVALPGAVLPGDRRIERAEKMGVVSNGIPLCSGEELNLTADGHGILILPADAPLGSALVDLYGDVVLDVDVKPNRGDALSIWASPARSPPRRGPRSAGTSRRSRKGAVRRRENAWHSRSSTSSRPRFVGRWVSRVRVGPSPDAVQMRLLAAGQRPIDNVVDASNYVMIELGKPIHVRRRRDPRAARTARR